MGVVKQFFYNKKGHRNMKRKNLRLLTVVLASLVLATGMCACGNNNTNDTQSESGSQAVEKVDAADATDLLTKVWDTFDAETEKFASFGGSVEAPVDGAPGKFAIDNADELQRLLVFPADQVKNIDDAASLVHMMNSNTFTGAVYHLADTSKQEELATALKDNIKANQWLCGSPERLTIWGVGDEYIVCVFGTEQNASVFKTRLEAVYEGATVLADESLVQ